MLRVVIEREGEIVSDGLFRKDLISVGRQPDNDVVLEDPVISSQHLLVRHDESLGFFRLFDQSQNGTFWEGERISTLRFDSPTVLRIAEYQVTLIPVKSTGTAESDVEEPIDLFARTAVEPIPQYDEAASTAPYRKVVPPQPVKDGELRSISTTGELKSLVFFGEALIGRAPECDLQFLTRDISRRHALIFEEKSGYSIRRLSGKNPLFVNGREVAVSDSVPLRDGDVIHICDEEIVYLYPSTQPRSEASQKTVPLEASPNVDLTVTPRGCSDPTVVAIDVIGFLGSKTWQKFEDAMRRQALSARRLLIDLGYLVGIDREGMQSLGRIITEAEHAGVRVQLIRVTPRIADLLSYSQLKQMLSLYISKSEDTAIKRLHA